MTTIRVEDILRKKQVPTRYQPNSYRIFCDEIGNHSVPQGQGGNNKYVSQAPEPLYTQPMIVPAQAIEDRNRPHADRAAGFLRENARTLNEPVNRVMTRNVSNQEEKRWWEWNLPVEVTSAPNSLKKRSYSSSNLAAQAREAAAQADASGFQTTYQKDHGYLKTYVPPVAPRIGSVNENNGSATRHTFNPNNAHAVGIIPINDLNNYTKNGAEQKVFADKMSFEHNYDSRKETNYPIRGKRQGAYVLEQTEPKAVLGTRNYIDQNKGASVWDAMHLDESPVTRQPPLPSRPSAEKYRQQRRDPIGYFEDSKFGGSNGGNINGSAGSLPPAAPLAHPPAPLPQNKHVPQAPPELEDISYQTKALAYQPTWSNINADFQLQRLQQQQQSMMSDIQQPMMNANANDLLDKAMMYQRPMINGH